MRLSDKLDSLSNPLLDDMRNWIQNKSLLVTGIKRKVLMDNGKFDYQTITHLGHNDARFLLTGIQIVEALSNNPTPKHLVEATRIFSKSTAVDGWEARALPSGRYMIVRLTDETCMNQKSMDIQPYEADAINTISELTRYYLGQV